jgi:hypothetical protein
MKKLFSLLVFLFMAMVFMGCERTDKTYVEAPDIIGDSLSQAKLKINGEFKLNVINIPSHQYLPGFVLSYGSKIKPGDKIESGSEIDVNVSGYPKDSFSLSDEVDYVSYISRITGPGSINAELLRSAGVGCTDLGIPIDLGDEVILLYGDTYSDTESMSGFWNSNFIARTKDTTLWDGILFDSVVTTGIGIVRPFAQGLHDGNYSDSQSNNPNREVTKIPTGGIKINNDIYIFYMSVRFWGIPGEWKVNYNQVVKTDSSFQTFTEVGSLRWPESMAPNFAQIFPIVDNENPDIIYLLGIPGGRNGGTTLARVNQNNFENFEEYEYYVSEGTWSKGSNGLAQLKSNPYYIIDPLCGEMSIMYNRYLQKWMAVYLRGSQIVMVTADEITGPYSLPKALMSSNEFGGLYGGFVLDKFTEYDGKKFYIQLSQWLPIYQTSVVEVILK